MKNTKCLLVLLLSVVILLGFTSNVFAEDFFSSDDYTDVKMEEDKNTSSSNELNLNTSIEKDNTNTNTNINTNTNTNINTNTSNSNTSLSNTNKTSNDTTNRSVSNTNTLANTGLSDFTVIMFLFVVICVVSAIYSLKKVNDYKKL